MSATGGRSGLVRTAARQTSSRSVLSGIRRSHSSALSDATALAWRSPSTRAATRSARAGGPPRRTGSGRCGEADVLLTWPSGICRRRTAWTPNTRAAPAAAARASPPNVSAALMSMFTLARTDSSAAVRSARCRARE
jgi:hypothetical protein